METPQEVPQETSNKLVSCEHEQTEPHTCPYQEDICNDNSIFCTCCSCCQEQCCQDI